MLERKAMIGRVAGALVIGGLLIDVEPVLAISSGFFVDQEGGGDLFLGASQTLCSTTNTSHGIVFYP